MAIRRKSGTERSREMAFRRRSRDEFRGSLTEFMVFESLLDDGWEVLSKGWPDFLAFRGDEVRMIEVKAHRQDHPSEAQARLFKGLLKIGITVEVIRPGDLASRR